MRSDATRGQTGVGRPEWAVRLNLEFAGHRTGERGKLVKLTIRTISVRIASMFVKFLLHLGIT